MRAGGETGENFSSVSEISIYTEIIFSTQALSITVLSISTCWLKRCSWVSLTPGGTVLTPIRWRSLSMVYSQRTMLPLEENSWAKTSKDVIFVFGLSFSHVQAHAHNYCNLLSHTLTLTHSLTHTHTVSNLKVMRCTSLCVREQILCSYVYTVGINKLVKGNQSYCSAGAFPATWKGSHLLPVTRSTSPWWIARAMLARSSTATTWGLAPHWSPKTVDSHYM